MYTTLTATGTQAHGTDPWSLEVCQGSELISQLPTLTGRELLVVATSKGNSCLQTEMQIPEGMLRD